ncbi:MAG: hypothetical protein M1169_06215 [Firmicutes bacterium]|nr:hypothetical protein [Bacillota bacterium]
MNHQEVDQNQDDQIEVLDDPYSMEKVFGIATLGAVGSLGLYFLYQTLSDDTKQKIKDRFVSGFKAALRSPEKD